MNEVDTDVVFLVQVGSEMFGTIDGAVLPTGTTEGDLEVGEIPFDEALYMMIDECIDGLEESEDLAILFQKIDDGLIQSGHLFVLIVFTGVMGRTAVKDITASVAGLIRRDASFKGERVDRY